jgi:LysM repeat protein
MPESAAGDGPGACPFVALVDDRDGRSAEPDPRHRCFAEVQPAPRALAHQAHYCLGPEFHACPTFQDWARREAARVIGAAPAPLAQAVEKAPWAAPGPRPPVEPAEEAARPGSRVVGLWGSIGEDDVARRSQRPVTDDATVVGLPAEKMPRADQAASPPVATPSFLAEHPRPGGLAGRADQPPSAGQTFSGQAPRRLRSDDAGWDSQVEVRRNLPVEPNAHAEETAARLRPSAGTAGGADLPSEIPAAGQMAQGPQPAGGGALEEGSDNAPLPIYERLAAAPPPPPLDPEATAAELAAFLRRRAGSGEPGGPRPAVYPSTPMTGVPSTGAASGRGSPDLRMGHQARPSPGGAPVYEARPGTGVVGVAGIPAAYPPEAAAHLRPGSASLAARAARPAVPVGSPQARPAIAGIKPRVTRDRKGPPWEPPAREDAYPAIRGRVSLPRIPRALILAVALFIAALLIFLAPSFFAGGGNSASPSPAPSGTPAATATASGSPLAVSTPAPPSAGEAVVYTVVAGDNLSAIAAKFGVTVEALLAANPQIKDANQIAIGDQITIPPRQSPAARPTPAKGTAKPTPKPTPRPT